METPSTHSSTYTSICNENSQTKKGVGQTQKADTQITGLVHQITSKSRLRLLSLYQQTAASFKPTDGVEMSSYSLSKTKLKLKERDNDHLRFKAKQIAATRIKIQKQVRNTKINFTTMK